MKQPWDMTETERKPLWEALARNLKIQALPTKSGMPRTADVDEFMMMCTHQDGTIGFKHRDSRNYVFLIPRTEFPFNAGAAGYQLYIPITREPFMRGEFDSFAENDTLPVHSVHTPSTRFLERRK